MLRLCWLPTNQAWAFFVGLGDNPSTWEGPIRLSGSTPLFFYGPKASAEAAARAAAERNRDVIGQVVR